jgi:hypothetical protein
VKFRRKSEHKPFLQRWQERFATPASFNRADGERWCRAEQVPAIKDRVAQTAAGLVLEPIFEADLQPEQYAYRPDRSALAAVRHVHKLLNTGHGQIVDAEKRLLR